MTSIDLEPVVEVTLPVHKSVLKVVIYASEDWRDVR